jgi:hypothetical protein
MAISFQSDEEVLRKLRDKLRKMTDQELIRFGKEVRRLAENPFRRQLEEARREWTRRKLTISESMTERTEKSAGGAGRCATDSGWSRPPVPTQSSQGGTAKRDYRLRK